MKRGKDLERWGDGVSLANLRWMRHIPLLAKAAGIYHYRLGKTDV